MPRPPGRRPPDRRAPPRSPDTRPRDRRAQDRSKPQARPPRRFDDKRRPPPRPAKPRLDFAAAAAILDFVDATAEPADRARHAWFRDHKRFDAGERAALVELTDTIYRARAALDWWVTQRGQGLRPDNRRRLLAHAVLVMGWTAEQTVYRAGRMDGFAPPDASEVGLLRALEGHTIDHPDMPLSARFNIPDWVEPLLRARFRKGLEDELAAMQRPAPVDLRANALKSTRDAALAALGAEGLHARATPLSPLGLRLSPRANAAGTQAFVDGLVEVQDEGSQIAALLVDAAGAKLVVDFCAGAGGKTLALAGVLGNRGRLVAMDVSAGRLQRAKLRLRRAGAHNVECRVTDAKWIKRHAGTADRVLVDAPCTGSGVWRRKPDARWRLRPSDLGELAQRQAGILDSAARLVRAGGRLVYVTCSLFEAENERQIEAFLARHPEFAVLPVPDVWPQAIGGAAPEPEPYLRLTPARHGTDGFFVAILTRRG